MMVMQTAAIALSSLLILAAPRLIQVGGIVFSKFLFAPNFDERTDAAAPSCMLRVLRSRHEDGQLFKTSVDRTEKRHSTTAAIKIQQSEIQFAASLTDNLQRVGDVSRDEHDCAYSQERFAHQLMESTIGREKKNQPWLHWIPPGDRTWCAAASGELEVSAALGAHLHCSLPLLLKGCELFTDEMTFRDL